MLIFHVFQTPVTTPIPLNLSDEDLLLAPRRSRELSEPTVTTYQIVTADLVFLQQQWNQPSRMQYGARQLSTALETGEFRNLPWLWRFTS